MNYSKLFSAICKSGIFRPLQWRPGSKRSTHTINILQGHTSFALLIFLRIPSGFHFEFPAKHQTPRQRTKGRWFRAFGIVWHCYVLISWYISGVCCSAPKNRWNEYWEPWRFLMSLRRWSDTLWRHATFLRGLSACFLDLNQNESTWSRCHQIMRPKTDYSQADSLQYL